MRAESESRRGLGTLLTQSQWYLDAIHAPKPIPAMAGAGVTVAVVDSGVGPHPALAGQLVPGFNVLFLGDGKTTDIDPQGHGTGVASLIAASQGNGGMVSVAPGAKILPVRAFHCNAVTGFIGGIFNSGDCITEGISFMRAFQALTVAARSDPTLQVVNVSGQEAADVVDQVGSIFMTLIDPLSSNDSNSLAKHIHGAAAGLVNANIALVVAAGNSTGTPAEPFGMQYPANVSGAFAVAAVDQNGNVAPFSTHGSDSTPIAIAAPGDVEPNTSGLDGLLVANAPGATLTFTCATGTSSAAPIMSGAVANVLSPGGTRIPGLSGAAAAKQVTKAATPLGFPPNDVGSGEVNLAIAVAGPSSLSLGYTGVVERVDDVSILDNGEAWVLFGFGKQLGRMTAVSATGSIHPVTPLPAPGAWIVGDNHVALLPGVERFYVGEKSAAKIMQIDISTGTPVITELGLPAMWSASPLILHSPLRNILAAPLTDGSVTFLNTTTGLSYADPVLSPTSIVALAATPSAVGSVGASGTLAVAGLSTASSGLPLNLVGWSLGTTGLALSPSAQSPLSVFPVSAMAYGVVATPQADYPLVGLDPTSNAGAVFTYDVSTTPPTGTVLLGGLDGFSIDSLVVSALHNELLASEPLGRLYLLNGMTGDLLSWTQDLDANTVYLSPARMSPDGTFALIPDTGCAQLSNSGCIQYNGVLLVQGF